MTSLKKALKRENDGTPIGTAGNMYLDCDCGHHLPMPYGGATCVCGTRYDSRGFILKTDAASYDTVQAAIKTILNQ